MSLASLLLLWGTEYHVFRAVVLSIVATLAVGPNAALLCAALCHPPAAASSVSHHGGPSAASRPSHHGEPSAASSAPHHRKPSAGSSVAGYDRCDSCDNAVGAAQFLREDLRRNVSAPDVDQAVLAPRYQLAHSTIDARPGEEPGRQGSLAARHLPTILRI